MLVLFRALVVIFINKMGKTSDFVLESVSAESPMTFFGVSHVLEADECQEFSFPAGFH